MFAAHQHTEHHIHTDTKLTPQQFLRVDSKYQGNVCTCAAYKAVFAIKNHLLQLWTDCKNTEFVHLVLETFSI